MRSWAGVMALVAVVAWLGSRAIDAYRPIIHVRDSGRECTADGRTFPCSNLVAYLRESTHWPRTLTVYLVVMNGDASPVQMSALVSLLEKAGYRAAVQRYVVGFESEPQ